MARTIILLKDCTSLYVHYQFSEHLCIRRKKRRKIVYFQPCFKASKSVYT